MTSMTSASLQLLHRAVFQRMSRKLRQTLASLAVALLLPAVHAAGEPLPMWEIRSTASKGAVYLLGSVHVCRESCLQFPESVLRRFRSSQALAVELDPTNADLMGKMLEAMSLPQGQTLTSKLSVGTTRKMQNVAGNLGLPMMLLDNMRPIMAATMLSTMAAQQQGLSMQNGIDVWFLQQARATGKPVRELETIERQLQALTASPERDQISSLEEALDMIEKRRFGPYLEELIQSWQTGNLNKLSKLMSEGMGSGKALEQELLGKRNVEMADKISVWLARGEQVFVVIGAGHITGKGNVAELLERKGYSVRQASNDE
ncbi:TraB/GumN family protein [Uliginosibacterium sp. H3]|uniref:TraB/GumN family protein n=1 Tax=Uliginosibacterium silvisoli TaxID=3114758 RepID=A0ABU6K4N0_9RHOO|nr:TraB/GumN family protein [Uliginosibacterium sp. H3]